MKHRHRTPKRAKRYRVNIARLSVILCSLVLLAVGVTVGFALLNGWFSPAADAAGATASPSPSATALPTPTPTAEPSPSAIPTPSPSPSATPEGAPTATPVANGNTSGKPVGESAAVDRSYFDDALFIGDSRTEGFQLYSGLGRGTYYTHKGLTVSQLDEVKCVKTANGKVSVYDGLRSQKFGKIYIMFGINEMGYPRDQFGKEYRQMLQTIKQLQPQAQLYVQSILPVSAKLSATDKLLKNDKVAKFNQDILSIAAQENVAYLDVKSVLVDQEGNLRADASNDGVHVNMKNCKVWLEYLLTHTVR